MEAIMQHEIPFIQKLVSNNLRVSSFFTFQQKNIKKKKKKGKGKFSFMENLIPIKKI